VARLTGRTAPRATKASIAGVFGRAAPTYERAGPRFFGEVAGRLVGLADLPAGARVLDAATWWASDWSHGERARLELMRAPNLEAYRREAFRAIERCRERDGALHWRPEVVYALAVR
jgi:hypothetical protein